MTDHVFVTPDEVVYVTICGLGSLVFLGGGLAGIAILKKWRSHRLSAVA